MSESYPFIFFATTAFIWLTLFVQSHRLFYSFREKFPDVAEREIPYAFEAYRHPEKFFYFFRAKAVETLHADESLWKLRRQVRILAVLALMVPILGFSMLMLFVIMHLHR